MPRPIAARTNHDHFGFYQIGPYKTYSKIEAIEISARTGTDLQWNFNNHVFENFDWKTEPPHDLKYWYAERARQIRDTYDYIILMYSGGPDSWNMLKAFVDNNIFIDEISHYIVHEGTPVSLEAEYNYEVVATSYPTAKKLIETNPTYKNTVHRVIDGGSHLIERVSTANPYDYFYQEGNNFFGAWGTTFSEMRHRLPDYQRLVDKKQSVCFVWGFDKPHVLVSPTGQYQIKFSELALATANKPKHQFENIQGKFDEAFYWTPDMPELICKQAHLLKRYIENYDVSNVDYYNLKKVDVPGKDYSIVFTRQNQKYELTKHAIHRLIYEGWDTGSIVCDKPSSPVLSKKDVWWFKNINDRQTAWYTAGVAYLRNHIKKIHPTWWYEQPGTGNSGPIRACIRQCQILYNLN